MSAEIIHAFGAKPDTAEVAPDTPPAPKVDSLSVELLRQMSEAVGKGLFHNVCLIALDENNYPIFAIGEYRDANVHHLAGINLAIDRMKAAVGRQFEKFAEESDNIGGDE